MQQPAGVAGTRSGRSSLVSLLTGMDAIVSDKPLIAILPHSLAADLFLTRLALLHPDEQAGIWPKIRHVPLFGDDVIPPSPFNVGREPRDDPDASSEEE